MARYTEQSAVNYNQTPPSDDGAATEANRVKWATIKTKLADPTKTLADAIDDAAAAAFGRTFGSGVTSTSTNYTVLATDNGKVINVTSGSPTITLLAAGTATTEFSVTIKNSGNGTVTIDGDGSETIDGQTTRDLGKGEVTLFTDGSNWFSVTPLNHLSPGTGAELTISSGDIVPVDAYHTVDTESDAASDDLDTIDDANFPEGSIIVIRAANTARTVVVKNGSGNHTIHTTNGQDFDLDDDEKSITLQLRSAEWYEIARSLHSEWGRASAATTSGTSVDVTGIPAGVDEIVIALDAVSQDAANQELIIRLGTSGGIVSSGYNATAVNQGGGNDETSGIVLTDTAEYDAAITIDYHYILTRLSGDIWAGHGIGLSSTPNRYYAILGPIDLSGELTTVRLTTVGGSAAFDNGTLYVMYR